MSDTQAQDDNLEAPQSDSMAAFSDKMNDLSDALDVLYIPNNASGRNKFREQWPDIAAYIFGEELIKYDHDGRVDRDHRRELEEAALDRRLLLKTILQEIVSKSVDAGMLQMEYVGRVIDEFGSCVSKYLYAENIIERVRPGLLAQTQDKKDAKEQKQEDEQEKADDAIRAISAGSAVEAKTEESAVAQTAAVDSVEENVSSSDGSLDEEELERQRLADEKSILSNNVVEEKVDAPQQEASAKPKLEIAGMPPIADDMFEDVMPIDTSAPAPADPSVDESEQLPDEESVEDKGEASVASEVAKEDEQADKPPQEESSQEADPASIVASLLGGSEKKEDVAEGGVKDDKDEPEEPASNPAPPVDVEAAEKTDDAEVETQDVEENSKPESGTYKSLFNSLAKVA